MLGKSITKLIIVCDDKTVEYANYLRQLISMNDDKEGEIVGTEDGTVEAAVWLEKDYIANMATISSKEHVLFIGENKISKKEISSMRIRFDKFGMQYGWLGKRGMMIISNRIKQPETYDEFFKYCLGYQKKFEKVVLKKTLLDKIAGVSKVKPEFLIAGAGLAYLSPIVGIIGVANEITMIGKQKKIIDQQYRILTEIFYMDGLSKFLEG